MFMSEPRSMQLAGLLLPTANLPIYWRRQPEVIYKINFFRWEEFIRNCHCSTLPFHKDASVETLEEKYLLFYRDIANAQVKEICANRENSTILFPCINDTLSANEIVEILKGTELSLDLFQNFCKLNSLRCNEPPDCLALRSYSYAEKQIRKEGSHAE